METAKIIGIAGGSGSGKTTIVRRISSVVSDFIVIPQDNYYKSAGEILQRSSDQNLPSRPRRQISNDNISDFNFDHPSAFDTDLLYKQLRELKELRSIRMPQYDFVNHKRLRKTILVKPRKVIIFEGIMIFFESRIRDLIDLKLFVDTPDDIRFIRRLKRDIEDRGRTIDSVISQYLAVVRPGHYEFIETTKLYADLIVPEGGFNESAVQVLASFIKEIIR
jgi:uridine kinase